MITESFINSCFKLLVNKNSKVRRTKALYRDIHDIIKSWIDKETADIPIAFKNKTDLLLSLCDMLQADKIVDNAIDSLMVGNKYRDLLNYLDGIINDPIKDHEFQDIIRQIRLRKKMSALFKNYDEIKGVVDSVKDGSFDSIDGVLDDYETTIKKLYSNMMESNREVTLEAAASLDMVSDDYAPVIEMIRKKYERKNTTSTGFPKIDNDIMMGGGYEPSRLYIFGGGSGAGKSTIIGNSIIFSATNTRPLGINETPRTVKEGEISRVYVYVTLENTIEESLMRKYQALYRKTAKEMLDDINKNVDIKERINQKLLKNGSTIIMKYFPPMSVSSLDLMGVVDDAISKYGKESIAGLYVDYLDLLKADTKYDLYRMELGHITLSLKALAVEYNIPVVTASQLTRAVYRVQSADELGVDFMSESMKKVEHADFVMLMARDRMADNKVYGRIGKFRSGKSNLSLEFTVNFQKYLFESVQTAINRQSKDSCNADSTFGLTQGMSTL